MGLSLIRTLVKAFRVHLDNAEESVHASILKYICKICTTQSNIHRFRGLGSQMDVLTGNHEKIKESIRVTEHKGTG